MDQEIRPKRKKKIVYVIRNSAGGMQKHLLDLVSGFKEEYEVTVISHPNREIKQQLKEIAVPYLEVEIADKINIQKDIKSIFELRKILKSLKPDILHIHGNKSSFVCRIAAKLGGVKFVIVTVHNFLSWQKASFLKRNISVFVELFLSRWTKKIITVSEALKTNLVEIESIPADKIEVIPNYFREENIKRTVYLRKILQCLYDEKIILNVGRLHQDKDQLTLIEAMNYLNKNFKLAIVGEGKLQNRLEEKIDEMILADRIFLLGYRNDVLSLMKDADVFVLSSKREGMPMTIFEAMVVGTVVVATSVGGIPEVIKDGINGILVPPKNPKLLAQSIQRIIQDNALRNQIIKKARNTLQNFTYSKMLSSVNEIYEKA